MKYANRLARLVAIGLSIGAEECVEGREDLHLWR